jgi:hypothetical protein
VKTTCTAAMSLFAAAIPMVGGPTSFVTAIPVFKH